MKKNKNHFRYHSNPLKDTAITENTKIREVEDEDLIGAATSTHQATDIWLSTTHGLYEYVSAPDMEERSHMNESHSAHSAAVCLALDT